MSRQLTASDRTALIRLASELPKGSRERKAILAGLQRSPWALSKKECFAFMEGWFKEALRQANPNSLNDLDTMKSWQNVMVYATSDKAKDIVMADKFGPGGSSQYDRGPGRLVKNPPPLSLEAAQWWWEKKGNVQYTISRQVLASVAKRLRQDWPVSQGIR